MKSQETLEISLRLSKLKTSAKTPANTSYARYHFAKRYGKLFYTTVIVKQDGTEDAEDIDAIIAPTISGPNITQSRSPTAHMPIGINKSKR